MTTPSTPPAAPRPRPSPWLVAFATAGAPAAWLVHLSLSYYLVPRACAGSPVWLHLVTLVTAAVAVAAIAAAARVRAGAGPSDVALRYLGALGLLVGVLFLAATLAEGLPALLIDPCR